MTDRCKPVYPPLFQSGGIISRRRLVCNPTIQMSSSICIPNMTLLACKVVEKSLTKKCYRIMEGRTEGRTDRCKPVYPPLFQSGGIIIISTSHFGTSIRLILASLHSFRWPGRSPSTPLPRSLEIWFLGIKGSSKDLYNILRKM